MSDTKSICAPDLRSAMAALEKCGEMPIVVDDDLDPRFEIAQHYLANFATSPAHPRSGEEPVVIYTRPTGYEMPVLMGLFGARRRCEFLLGCAEGTGARTISQRLSTRTPARELGEAPCQAISWPEKLGALPTLSVTALDAGPYLTSGLVFAHDPENGVANLSIHRMRVVDAHRLTIWMLPGRDLDNLYRKAQRNGSGLPISINIGAGPIVYLTSSISSPFIREDESELEFAGGVQGAAIEISRCKTQNAWCLSQSQIVIEGEITGELLDEYSGSESRYGMPEFLGYMGMGKAKLPVVNVSQVTSQINPIYQTFLGPGKEQSELLALPTEAGMIGQLSNALSNDATVHDARYLAAAGGQLMLALRIEKKNENEGFSERVLHAATKNHLLVKVVFLVDTDIDVSSESDLLWAMATRFQPSRDLVIFPKQRGFPLDPSQAAGYLAGTTEPTTDKYLLDLTVPVAERERFRRVTTLVP